MAQKSQSINRLVDIIVKFITDKKLIYNFIATLAAGGIIAYYISIHYPQYKTELLNKQREKIHGVWLIQTDTLKNINPKYDNLRLIWLVNLATDNNLNISGSGELIKENNKWQEIIYKRESRMLSNIQGNMINDKLLLSWQTTNPEGIKSIQIFQGSKVEDNLIKGDFFNDFAYQIGTFCAKMYPVNTLYEFDFEKLPDQICE